MRDGVRRCLLQTFLQSLRQLKSHVAVGRGIVKNRHRNAVIFGGQQAAALHAFGGATQFGGHEQAGAYKRNQGHGIAAHIGLGVQLHLG